MVQADIWTKHEEAGDICRAHKQFHFWRTTPRKPLPCSGVSVAKRQYTSAFSLVFHALTASSAQKLATVVLEGELAATSPVLRACSTPSPVGVETPAAVFGVVGASST